MKQKFKLPVKKRKLVGIGFFYKNDEDTGLGLAAHIGDPDYDLLLQGARVCEKNFDQEVRDVLLGKGEYAKFNKDLSLFQEQVKRDMEICIPWLKDRNATNRQRITHLIGFLTGVIYLTKWGLLQQDNYNGTLYNYVATFK